MHEQPREAGVVKVFYPLKGFGFITREKGRDIFFHFLDIVLDDRDASLFEGDKVEFSIGERNGKPKALMVKKIG
ncbi:cold shock domain-containing protein [Rhodocyclus tenuis]|uniref:CspA family cold shock protein n=1 Tax=Rhodocyclus tenuis TaxID=1066 RepID=A0A840GBI9_RHOTE|nr:cold shock domain-containing protein [Rhodocyclus tenuis]MBB4248028.1 CspA family cold shock protein [Rhodocyclus tenuis]